MGKMIEINMPQECRMREIKIDETSICYNKLNVIGKCSNFGDSAFPESCPLEDAQSKLPLCSRCGHPASTHSVYQSRCIGYVFQDAPEGEAA